MLPLTSLSLPSLVAEVLPKGARPFVLLALLALAVPSLFTLQKLLELPLLGERSHQLFALPEMQQNRA